MTIVNQSREMLLNYNNVCVLGTDKKTNKKILSVTNNGDTQELGTYATEERAKEVLQEIIEAIRGKSILSINESEVKSEVFGGFYEMPKE